MACEHHWETSEGREMCYFESLKSEEFSAWI